MTSQPQKTVLENGIRVLSDSMEGVRSVSVGVAVDVGPKDELPHQRGFAHLVEHMLFQGTGDRDAMAIAEMMEVGGGAMGAFTARDYTIYHATVLDDYLPFALEVLGDMLCNSIVPEAALERQRSVILNEIAGRDDPVRVANDLLKATLWPDHPLGFPTAGLRSTIEQASRESLLDFMSQYYIADKLVITAAGNVEHSNFVDQVRDNFWQMENIDTAPPAPHPPVINLNSVIARPRDLQQVYFAMAWPAPAYSDPNRYALHVFSSMFGGGPTSRLYQRLREEQGMVYHIASQYQAYGNTGALVVEGATLPNTLIPVLAGTLIELIKMSETEINPDDHHRALQAIISQHLVSGDSPYVRMSRLALQELYFKQALSSDEVIDALHGQSPDEIRRIAEQIFTAGLPTISLVGPISDEMLQSVGDMLSDFGAPVEVSFAPTHELQQSVG